MDYGSPATGELFPPQSAETVGKPPKPQGEHYAKLRAPRTASGHLALAYACIQCGREKIGRADRVRSGRAKFCGQACKLAWHRANHPGYRHQGENAPAAIRDLAGQVVRDAIARGQISKPTACQLCGATGVRIDAHHPDYERMLYVAFLCWSCHGKAHRCADTLKAAESLAVDHADARNRKRQAGLVRAYRRAVRRRGKANTKARR